MATVPYGGDEVSSVVFDIGCHSVRAGFGGEDVPKAIFPSVIGVCRSSKDDMLVDEDKSKQQAEQDKYYVGSKSLQFRRDHMECESPFNKDGLIENFDHFERLIEHTISSRLRIQGSEHPMLFSEAPHTSMQQREKLTQLLFEKFQIPAFFLAKSPVLSAFANGKSTALVVDSGASGTVVSPVYDGYVLAKSIVRNYYGGDWITDQLLGYYEETKNLNIRPHYAFEKKRNAQTNAFEVKSLDFPNTTASYRQFATRLVVNDLKEATCRVAETPFDEKLSLQMNLATVSYELPDGTPVDVGVERYNATELLFLPSSIREMYRQQQPNIVLSNTMAANQANNTIKPEQAATGLVDVKALHLLAYESIMKCDNDIKKELFGSTILTGGNTLFHGLAKRFESELQTKVGPNIKVKPPMAASALPVERKCSAWIGGSILASTGTFQALWCSKEEFGEHGSSIVQKKCP